MDNPRDTAEAVLDALDWYKDKSPEALAMIAVAWSVLAVAKEVHELEIGESLLR